MDQNFLSIRYLELFIFIIILYVLQPYSALIASNLNSWVFIPKPTLNTKNPIVNHNGKNKQNTLFPACMRTNHIDQTEEKPTFSDYLT